MDTQTPPAIDEAHDIEQNKDIAAFGYLWVMSVIVYFLKRNSPFVRWHCKQAMVLFAISIPIWFIPFIGRALELVVMCGAVYGFMGAAQGQRRNVPIIGPLAHGEITLRQAWKQIVDFAVRVAKSLRDSTVSKVSKPEATKAPAAPTTPTPAAAPAPELKASDVFPPLPANDTPTAPPAPAPAPVPPEVPVAPPSTPPTPPTA